MAIDYDAPRPREEELLDTTPLTALIAAAPAHHEEADEAELAEQYELPGADLSGEELAVTVVPRQQDEFICARCFLVHHHSQLAYHDATRDTNDKNDTKESRDEREGRHQRIRRDR